MIQDEKGERLIFIGGCPRSGTTLVQNILDSHPDVYGGPEFTYIPQIMKLRRTLLASIEAEANIASFCHASQVNDAIRSMIENLLLPAADRRDCTYLSEKTPFNVLAFTDLLDVFPRARCIQVVRDPRAIVLSMMQVGVKARNKGINPPSFSQTVEAAIECIDECLKEGMKAARTAPSRVHNLCYETLVSDPQTAVTSLCEFLQLEPVNSMLNPSKHKHEGEKSLDGVYYDRDMYYRDPDRSIADKWKKQLHPNVQKLVMDHFRTHPDYSELGYNFD